MLSKCEISKKDFFVLYVWVCSAHICDLICEKEEKTVWCAVLNKLQSNTIIRSVPSVCSVYSLSVCLSVFRNVVPLRGCTQFFRVVDTAFIAKGGLK